MSTTEATTRATVSAQVPLETRRELERLAAEDDRSLSAQVRRAIHEHLRSDQGEKEGDA